MCRTNYQFIACELSGLTDSDNLMKLCFLYQARNLIYSTVTFIY